MLVMAVLALCLALAHGSERTEEPPHCSDSESWSAGRTSSSLLQCVGHTNELEWPSAASAAGGSFVVPSGSTWLIRGASVDTGAVDTAAFPSRISLHSAAVLALERTRMQGLVDWHGGALSARDNSNLTVVFSEFVDNEADHTGGAIWIGQGCVVQITRTGFERNRAGIGGAIHTWTGAYVVIESSIFQSNEAGTYGAALYAKSGTMLTITETTFVHNSAEEGGGIYADESVLSVTSCNFTNNTASLSTGSAVRTRSPVSTLIVDTGFFPLAQHDVELDGTVADCTAHPPTTCGIGHSCTYERFSLRCSLCPAPLFGDGVTCETCGNAEREAANGGACACKPGYYGTTGKCMACPARPGFVGACPGGGHSPDGIAPLFPRPGFWMENREMALSTAELVCPVDYCLGWSTDLDLEAQGNRVGVEQVETSTASSCGAPPHFCAVLHTGRLCAECVDGAYKMPSGRCCHLGSWWPAYATAVICIFVGMLISFAAFLVPLSDDTPELMQAGLAPAQQQPHETRACLLSTDVAAALGTLAFFYQTLQLLNFPPKTSEWWYTPGSHLRDSIHYFVVVMSDSLSFDVKPERYPSHSMHPCKPLQCPPPFALGVLGSVYTTTLVMPLLVTIGCCLGCLVQSLCWCQDNGAYSDKSTMFASECAALRSSSNVSTASGDTVLQQEASRWAANRSLRSPETERLDSSPDSSLDTIPATANPDSGSGDHNSTLSPDGESADVGHDEEDSVEIRNAADEDSCGSRGCSVVDNALLPSCCVVAPSESDRTKARAWRCAGLIYQFCWLPIGRASLAVVLPRGNPLDNNENTLLLQGDPSVAYFVTPEAKCACIFGACVLLFLGIGIPDLVVCWGCWRAQPAHDTDDAIHPARALHPALLSDLYRSGWAAGVWFVLDAIRKFSLVFCALAADGSSTPFDLPRWYVPGQTPVVTTLLLSLILLAVGQPYRNLRHQCHEALSLACLILVAQTADSTFAGWCTLGLTLVIPVHIYRLHRTSTANPLGRAFNACKEARWRRNNAYTLAKCEDVTPKSEESDKNRRDSHGGPVGFVGLRANV